MADKKGVNPLYVGLGMVAGALGAVGAVFFSKKENRKKAAKLVKEVKKDGGSKLNQALKVAREALTDVTSLANQIELDTPKKTAKKKLTAKKK